MFICNREENTFDFTPAPVREPRQFKVSSNAPGLADLYICRTDFRPGKKPGDFIARYYREAWETQGSYRKAVIITGEPVTGFYRPVRETEKVIFARLLEACE